MELPEEKDGICIGMEIPDQCSLQKMQKDVTLGPEQLAIGGPGKFFKEKQGDCQFMELCKILRLGLRESMAWT